MSRWLGALLCIFAVVCASAPAAAHEVRPAYLEIRQTASRDYAITWKQPTLGEMAIHLAPSLSSGWLNAPPIDQYAAEGYLIRRWNIHSAVPLSGQRLEVEGLANTITDVLVRLRPLGAPSSDLILRPESPAATLDTAVRATATWSFLFLGIQHILTGPDHLLFVLGLILIVRDRWSLLKTISAFTLSHSLTLAAATLGLIQVSPPVINALIALSILFVAPEALRAMTGGDSLTIRHTWIVAFTFGLLHGLGFARGLSTLGLDRGSLAQGLLLFNLGVEIGQLAFVGLVLALVRAARLMLIRWSRPIAMAPAYVIGALGAMWTLQYVGVLLGSAP